MGAGKVLKNFLAQLLVQNLWNFTSEQRPGITFALSSRAGKETLLRPPRTTFNTNPYLASFLTGVLAREQRRRGIAGVSLVLEGSLAAQGDDLYWRVLRPTALLAAMVLALVGKPVIGLAVFLVGFNLLAQGERLVGYVRGLKRGRGALKDVIARMTRVKRLLLTLGGVLMGLLAAVMIFRLDVSSGLLQPDQWMFFIPCLAVSLLFAVFKGSVILNLVVNLVVLAVLGAFL